VPVTGWSVALLLLALALLVVWRLRRRAPPPGLTWPRGRDAPDRDRDLVRWLESHHDEVMWWKEFLHHEGTGSRSAEEETEALARYRRAMQELATAVRSRCQLEIARWMRMGLSQAEAEARWQELDEELHDASRLRYALGKD
jgi:hypothetical protein